MLVASVAAIPAPVPASTPSFVLQNGKDAIALNKKFKSLKTSSKCTSGDVACIGSKFAQCDHGKFVITPCGGGLICAALPLVLKPGTSITCTTAADRDTRIATTGAKTGGSTSSSSASSNPAPAPAKAPASSDNKNSFALANGKDAQALNAKFTKLTAKSICTDGDVACVGKQFAKCDHGKFVLFGCGANNVQCVALPLVNSRGTSVTCATLEQAKQRIAATGAGSSLVG